MNLKFMQKFYIKCLIIDNKISDYTKTQYLLFDNINILLSEEAAQKLVTNIKGFTLKTTIEEITSSLKLLNKDNIADIIPIKFQYNNKNNSTEEESKKLFLFKIKILKIIDEKNAKIF